MHPEKPKSISMERFKVLGFEVYGVVFRGLGFRLYGFWGLGMCIRPVFFVWGCPSTHIGCCRPLQLGWAPQH